MFRRLIITGDSHCVALKQGLHLLNEKTADLPDGMIVNALGNGYYMNMPFSEVDAECVKFTYPEYKKTFEGFGIGEIGEHNDDMVFGFSMGLNSPPAFRDPMWRTYAPWSLSEQTGLKPVFSDVLPNLFLPKWRHIQAFLQSCIHLKVPFFVISGPPPKRTHDCIQKDGTDENVVLEVNRLYRKTVENWLTAQGVQVVHTPDEVLEDSGFLAPEFHHPDPEDQHHANAKYGEIYLKKIVDFYEANHSSINPQSPSNPTIFRP